MSEKFVIKNGLSDYKILIPLNADADEIDAAKDLQFFLKDATNAELKIVKSKNCGEKYFSIGNTDLLTSFGIVADYFELGEQGFRIKTKDDNILIYAAKPKGTLNGAYGYLELILNFDFYCEGKYELERTNEIKFRELDIIDIPDVAVRVGGYGCMRLTSETKNRMRMKNYRDIFPDVGDGGAYHNCFGYLPVETYSKEHPEWFNEKLNQLCYTAHGDKESLSKMVATVAQTVYDTLKNTGRDKIVFALIDNDDICECEACKQIKYETGANTGAVIRFLKKVSETVERWFVRDNDYRKDSFLLVFYAYHALVDAPVKYSVDNDGKENFEFVQDMKFGNHLAIMYANSLCDLAKWYYHPDNKNYVIMLNKWKALGDKIHLWVYDNYFRNGGYMFPYASFRNCKELYRFSKENGIAFVMAEGQALAKSSTSFVLFRCYLHSKFGWNIGFDFDELKTKFFTKVYGSQYKSMLQIFNHLLNYLDIQVNELKIDTWSTQTLDFENPKFWNFEDEIYYIETIEDVQQKLKSNNELLSSYYARLEEISPLYIVLKLFKESIDVKRYEEYLERFKAYIIEFGIERTGQGETVENCLEEFNRNLSEKRRVNYAKR